MCFTSLVKWVLDGFAKAIFVSAIIALIVSNVDYYNKKIDDISGNFEWIFDWQTSTNPKAQLLRFILIDDVVINPVPNQDHNTTKIEVPITIAE